MGLNDYDKIINIIESNLSEEWYEVLKMLEAETGDSIRVLTDFRRRIAGDGLTIEQYFKKRRIIRILGIAIETGRPIIDVAGDYGCYDPSTINKQVNKLFGKTPGEVVESGNLEGKDKLILIEDIIGRTYDGDDEIDEKVAARVETYKDLIKEQIDTITDLRTQLSLARKRDIKPEYISEDILCEKSYANLMDVFYGQVARRNKLRETYANYKIKPGVCSDPILKKKRETEAYKKILQAWKAANSELYGFYKMFDEMESLRSTYGFDVETIIDLQADSFLTGMSLHQVCINYINEQEYALDEGFDFDPSDMDDFYEEFYTDELTPEESYRYYFGDDEFEFDD